MATHTSWSSHCKEPRDSKCAIMATSFRPAISSASKTSKVANVIPTITLVRTSEVKGFILRSGDEKRAANDNGGSLCAWMGGSCLYCHSSTLHHSHI